MGIANASPLQGCHRLIDPALHRAGSGGIFQIHGRRKLDPRGAGPIIYSAWFTHRHEAWLRGKLYIYIEICI